MKGSFAQFDVVVMPFPFAERQVERKRPAIIVSSAKAMEQTGVAVVTMVTRAAAPPWHSDIPILDPAQAGLHKPSKVRMKLHSVALEALNQPIGAMAPADQQLLRSALQELFAL